MNKMRTGKEKIAKFRTLEPNPPGKPCSCGRRDQSLASKEIGGYGGLALAPLIVYPRLRNGCTEDMLWRGFYAGQL
jgi:hypothetical protein